MSRNDEGRISRAQSAREQLYQNFCTNAREAGGLPFHHHLHSLTEALVIYPNKLTTCQKICQVAKRFQRMGFLS